jgi:hypothetical protein
LTATLTALWSHLPGRTRGWMAFHIVVLISVGLWLDVRLGWTGQHLATAWAFGVLAWCYWLGRRVERQVLVLATVLSAVGEVFLSLVWGVYDYQFHNVPLFVPPGHALLMTLGILVARQFVRSGSALVSVVTGVALLWAIYVGVTDTDRYGVALFGLYAVCLWFGLARPLYATMFVLALIMELYGTALGNWAWAPNAPWVNFSAANPPFSAGAFYCALDLLVLGILHRTQTRSSKLAVEAATKS